MATKPRHRLKINLLVKSEDTALPEELEADFSEVFQPMLQTDLYNCDGFPHHSLKGDLTGYRTLDIR